MTKVALVALASVVITVGPAHARGGGGGGGGGGFGSPGHGGHGRHQQLRSSIPTRLFPHHHFFARNGLFFHNGRFWWGGYPAGYGVGYGYGLGLLPDASSPTTYVAYPSSGYAPSYATTSPALQTVVELASGRYLLQGDGVTTPYRWVWLPNAPSEAPPALQVPAPPARGAEPIRQLDYYRWTDADGVVHLTDTIDRIPERYRAKATKSRT